MAKSNGTATKRGVHVGLGAKHTWHIHSAQVGAQGSRIKGIKGCTGTAMVMVMADAKGSGVVLWRCHINRVSVLLQG